MATQDIKHEPMPDGNQPVAMGATHRFYRFNIGDSQDDLSILLPEGTVGFGIRKSANSLKYEVHTAARIVDADGSSMIDSATEIAAGEVVPMRPARAGEYLNISHAAGNAAIGVFELMLEGGANLPSGASNLSTSDPGA